MSAAINETATFCFALTAERATPAPEFVMHPFVTADGHTLPSRILVFRMHPVQAPPWPGWHIRTVPTALRQPTALDVLVPLDAPAGGMPDRLAVGERFDFWVDVQVRRGAQAATYTSEIEVQSRGQTVARLPIELTVLPFVLPETPQPQFIADLDHRALFMHHIRGSVGPYAPPVDDWEDDPNRRRIDLVLSHTIGLLREHGLTPVLSDLGPVVRTQPNGGIELYWAQYDALVGPLLSGDAFEDRVPLSRWPVPVTPALATLEAHGDKSSGAALAADYLEQVSAHFVEKGWMQRAYAPIPGGPGSLASAMIRQLTRIVGSATYVPWLTRLCPQDLEPYGWYGYQHDDVSTMVEFWSPPAQFFDEAIMAGVRSRGQSTWIGVDRPPFGGSTSIHASSGDIRILSWQARSLGAGAVDLGLTNAWPPAEKSITEPAECLQFDSRTLLYPGTPFGLHVPVPSVRLKILRDAMQDAAYCALMASHNLDHVSGLLRSRLVGRSGTACYRTHFADGRPSRWRANTHMFDAARSLMVRELQHAVAGGESGESDSIARGLEWQRFFAETPVHSMSVDGVRVRLGSREEPGMDVEFTMALLNDARSEAVGRVSLEPMPEQWEFPEAPEAFRVPSGGMRRGRLIAHVPGLATDANGIIPFDARWMVEATAGVSANARLAAIVAAEARVAPKIDGDLSDWPALAGNVASDFVLVARERNGAHGELPQPLRPTSCFVLRDEQFLYIGVNAVAAPSSLNTSARRKRVDHDDLAPIPDELIEILIDPLNGATRSPADLYYIALKPGGSDVCERGVRLEPPCGEVRAWPVQVDVATAVHEDRWTSELRIPWSAFGEAGHRHAVWGFNVTRLDAEQIEFSTWSGASPNAYDPLSLGNLILP